MEKEEKSNACGDLLSPCTHGTRRYIVRDAEGTTVLYAREQNYNIVAEIAEIGNGLSLNRSGIREIYELAHCHMIDMVLVSDIFRLCRDSGQVLKLAEKFQKQDVSVESMIIATRFRNTGKL